MQHSTDKTILLRIIADAVVIVTSIVIFVVVVVVVVIVVFKFLVVMIFTIAKVFPFSRWNLSSQEVSCFFDFIFV